MVKMKPIYLLTMMLVHQSMSLSTSSVLYHEVFTYHNTTAQKAGFAYAVVDKIYYAFKQWFFTIIFCEFTYFENRILKYTQNMESGYPVLVLNSCPTSNKTKVKPRIDKHGQTAYVVTLNELSLDRNDLAIEAVLRTGVFKPRSPVIFVINVQMEVDDYFYYHMVTHFQLLWARKISNSVLIVWSDELRMYSYNPFFDTVSDITNVTNVSRYLSHQYYDLYGHALRVSVFRKIYIYDNGGPVTCDTRLATTVIKHLNAICVPLFPRDGSTVGDLLDNGTATGVTRDLLDGYTDMEFNSRILKNSYYGYIDTTYPLFQDPLCFIVKKSERQSSYATIINLISIKMLLLFMFNVNFLTTVGFVTHRLEANLLKLRRKSFTSVSLDMAKCFLRQTYDVKFSGPAFRTVVLTIMMYTLIINSVIDSIIISAISYPRYKSDINTMKDLLDTNLTLGIHNRHLKLFKNSMSQESFDAMQKRVEVFNDKKIRAFVNERQFQYAVLLRKSDTEAITRKPANLNKGRPLFHTVTECPIPCSIVYGLKYGSPYLLRLNTILFNLNQGGILDYWARTDEATTQSKIRKVIDTDDSTSKERKALNIDHLEEVFFVWMIGLVISTAVFMCEVIWNIFIQGLFII